jgi:glycosyltransferase involved in cell wall biosynthesis
VAERKNPALMVFADDWGRHPSSCQHLIRQLLPAYRVWWVNTIGMRPPGFDRATLVRTWEKLRHWFQPRVETGEQPDNLEVLNPRMWPWFSRRHDRRINRRLLLRQLRPILAAAGSETIAITTVPVVADLIGGLPVSRWVYYCVDDFSQWPGVDRAAVGAMEALLIRRADVLVAASETLQDRLAARGRAARLLPHGVDLEHWSTPRKLSGLLDGLERPLVVFWGLVDRRMDVDFVHRLSNDLTRGTVVLVGPEADAEPGLEGNPRVARLPGVAYEDLPGVAAEAAVLVMPYADLPVTQAMQPLKLTEYLATGKPVVARDLPSTRAWADALDLAATPEEFSRQVRVRLAEGLPPSQADARRRLKQQTWAQTALRFQELALQ